MDELKITPVLHNDGWYPHFGPLEIPPERHTSVHLPAIHMTITEEYGTYTDEELIRMYPIIHPTSDEKSILLKALSIIAKTTGPVALQSLEEWTASNNVYKFIYKIIDGPTRGH